MGVVSRIGCAVGLHRMDVVRHGGSRVYMRCGRPHCGRRRILSFGERVTPSDLHWIKTGHFRKPDALDPDAA